MSSPTVTKKNGVEDKDDDTSNDESESVSVDELIDKQPPLPKSKSASKGNSIVFKKDLILYFLCLFYVSMYTI